MTDRPTDDRRISLALLLAAICLIGVNMRTPITGIGPLLEQMSASTGQPLSVLSLLTSLPVLSWSIISSVAHPLTQRFGLRPVILAAIILLSVGTVVRSLPGVAADVGLWVGTLLVGATIAMFNVLMPAVVKRSFGRRSPVVTSIYTALFAGFGAVASSLVVPVSYLVSGGEGSTGWRVALVAMSATLPIAGVLWIWHMRQAGPEERVRPQPRSEAVRRSVWGDRTAWLVGLYMGTQSILFYAMLTWTAPFARDHGHSEIAAGNDVMLFQITGVIGSLTLPLLLRGRAERWIPALLPAFGVIGTVGLIVAPNVLVVWLLVQGLTSGASIAMALTLMASRARDHRTASALSGMSQSVGYVISGAAPLIFGWLHAATASWEWPLGYVIAGLIGQLVIGLFVGRDRYVFD